MESLSDLIGAKLKFYRKKNNLTQEEVGLIVNMDKQYISKIEKGEINLTISSIEVMLVLSSPKKT